MHNKKKILLAKIDSLKPKNTIKHLQEFPQIIDYIGRVKR